VSSPPEAAAVRPSLTHLLQCPNGLVAKSLDMRVVDADDLRRGANS
jgi:hypothetical protein